MKKLLVILVVAVVMICIGISQVNKQFEKQMKENRETGTVLKLPTYKVR